MILVTGGAGFIGANFVLDWLAASDEPVINLDALTYAGNRETLAPLEGDARHLLRWCQKIELCASVSSPFILSIKKAFHKDFSLCNANRTLFLTRKKSSLK